MYMHEKQMPIILTFSRGQLRRLFYYMFPLHPLERHLAYTFLSLVKTSFICTRFIIWGYKCASLTILIYLFT